MTLELENLLRVTWAQPLGNSQDFIPRARQNFPVVVDPGEKEQGDLRKGPEPVKLQHDLGGGHRRTRGGRFWMSKQKGTRA